MYRKQGQESHRDTAEHRRLRLVIAEAVHPGAIEGRHAVRSFWSERSEWMCPCEQGRGLRAACDRQDYTSDRTLPRDRTIVIRMCSCVGQMTYGAQ